MKKSIALILTVVALAAMTITAGASEAAASDTQQYTVQSYTEAEYNTTSDGYDLSPFPPTDPQYLSSTGYCFGGGFGVRP